MTYQGIIGIIKRTGETQENLWMLGCWFERYGNNFWNGECFNTEKDFDGRNLYPIYEQDAEDPDQYNVVGYELR